MSAMKWLCMVGVGWLSLALSVWAAGPNEAYVRIYTLMQQGERLESANEGTQALAAYLDARQGLLRLKRSQPEWNPKVVDFRLRYLDTKIERLAPRASVPALTQPAEPAVPGVDVGAERAAAANAQLISLEADLERAQGENRVLQAKLREALTALPAAVDPLELEKAQARQRELAAEVSSLREQLASAQAQVDAKADVQTLKETQAELERTRKSLSTQTQMAEALQGENQLLKQLVTRLRTESSASGDTQARLDQALAELALMRSEADILKLEKAALEQRLTSRGASSGELTEARASAATLARERDALQAQLAQANEALAARSMKPRRSLIRWRNRPCSG